ncbi:hypothetical protein BJ165DRAFT_1527840 [Panaeolus papilionaceus]|nr:hypothetical protein BJ165DRAFT_1527840 [Panaeolus papilionaceus]
MPPLGSLETQSPPTPSDFFPMLAPLPSPTFSVAPPEFSTPSTSPLASPSVSIAKIYTLNPGIGLVSINPSAASSLLSPASHSATTPPLSSSTHEPSPTEINESNSGPSIPVSKLVILGCVVGGILFFTICILVLFGGAGLCGFCRHARKRRNSKKGGKGIAGGLIYIPGDKSKRASNSLAHAMANGLAVGGGFASPHSKLGNNQYTRPGSNNSKFGGFVSSLFAFRSRHNSRESSPLHKSPPMSSYILGDKSRPTCRASRDSRGNAAELEGWTNLTPALLLGPVPVIQAHAQAHLERRDRAREFVRGSGGFDHEFRVSEEHRENDVVQSSQQWNEPNSKEKTETPQEIALQLLSTMKHNAKGERKEKAKRDGSFLNSCFGLSSYSQEDNFPDAGSQDDAAKSKFSVCSSQYSESSLSVIDLYSSGDEDSDEEPGWISGVDKSETSGNQGSFSGGPPQLARCASARVLSLPPLAVDVQWDLPNLDQDSLAITLRGGDKSGYPDNKDQPASSSPSRPPRPPRPPTADSPTLSESVYLACSEVAYVLKCAGGGVLNEGEAAGQDESLLHDTKRADLKADASRSSAYSSSNPTPNNSMANSSFINPIVPISIPLSTLSTRQDAISSRDGRDADALNTSASSANTSVGSQSTNNISSSTGTSSNNNRTTKRPSRLLTGLASLTNLASTIPGASSSTSLPKQEKSRSSLLPNESGEYDRSAERLALARVPGATSASDRFGDAGVSTTSYASYAQGHGYGHDQPQDAQSPARNGYNQTPTRRPYQPPQTPPHSRSDGTISTEHARRSIQGYDSPLNHSNGYVQPHPYTYGPAAGYAYKPSRLSRIEGSPASVTTSAATGSATAVGSSATTESSRASPTPSPGLLRSLSNTSASSTSTFDSRHARTRSEPSQGPDDNTKAPRVSFKLATLPMQNLAKASGATDSFSGSQSVSQASELAKRGESSPRSLGKPQKKKRSPSYYHTDNEVDAGAESDIQEAVVRRIMKHRRSRSNSGWAYAGRGRR